MQFPLSPAFRHSFRYIPRVRSGRIGKVAISVRRFGDYPNMPPIPRNQVLVVGATRGLGASLAATYAADKFSVFATSRSGPPSDPIKGVEYINNIDVASEDAGPSLAAQLKKFSAKLNIVFVTAGYFPSESFDEPNFENEVKTYKICAVGPVFIVQNLVKAGLMAENSKIILVSSESGSITLRHSSEGGGNYAHHASKSALNMVGKLLSMDVSEKKVAVGMVHPGFMRTDMTKNVGFDKFYDQGGGEHSSFKRVYS